MIAPRPSPNLARLLPMAALLAASTLAVAQPPAARTKAATAPAPVPVPLSTPEKTEKVVDLANRYRFSERYTRDESEAGPGVVGPYRVAISETIRDAVDAAQGAPKRTETTTRMIYSERPIELNSTGGVRAAVRVFELAESRSTPGPAQAPADRPLQGLTVLISGRSAEAPQVLVLTEGHPLAESEHALIVREPSAPGLVGLLPPNSVRVGDTWRIPRRAAQALLGDSAIQGDSLVGKLVEVRKETAGPWMVAVFSVVGKVARGQGEASVNAEAFFTFLPSSTLAGFSPEQTFPPRPKTDVFESRGAFTELRIGQVTSGPAPEKGAPRLQVRSNRELTLHRQIGLAGGAAIPPRPAKLPEPTEANSWITRVHPRGRFEFRHPQDLIPPVDRPLPDANPDQTVLTRANREGIDVLDLEFAPRIRTPEDLKEELAKKYKLLKMEVVKGDEAWLPEPAWPGMKVHRIDASLKVAKVSGAPGAPRPGGDRIHFDGYLVLFGQTASMIALASTSREDVASYRDEVERVIRTIKLDPPRPPIR